MLKFAYQDFVSDRKWSNSSKENLKNIQVILGDFIDYCLEKDVIILEDVTTNFIKRYFINCQEERGNNTINTRLQRLRSFFNYCVEEKYITESPAQRVKRLKEDTKINVFSDEQINQMLGYYRSLRRRKYINGNC